MKSAPPAPTGPRLLIGLGNRLRGDDMAGLLVARRLRRRQLAHWRVIEHSGDALLLMEHWKAVQDVVIVDAMQSGAPPGTIVQIDAHRAPVPTDTFAGSTHALGLVQAVELARALNQLPERLTIFGLEGERFQAGTRVSPMMRQAVRQLVARLVANFTGRAVP